MLRASDIHKSFQSIEVLKGIDFRVEKGEIVSIVGASGAGKSTLLHILGTLDKPELGSVVINDQAVFNLSRRQLSRFRNQHIGFIFQFHNLLPEFSALDNTCMPAYIANADVKDAKRKGQELLNILGLSDRVDHKPSQLSGGEQQRVSVARALINDPVIVFADEPSGNLDSQNAKEHHALFVKLRESLNQTFVIVTHNKELSAMADRRLEIKDGKLV